MKNAGHPMMGYSLQLMVIFVFKTDCTLYFTVMKKRYHENKLVFVQTSLTHSKGITKEIHSTVMTREVRSFRFPMKNGIHLAKIRLIISDI